MSKKLALGTAQFGLPYGIANRKGRVEPKEVQAILRLAEDAGMDTLDTAMAYGSSEETLGAQSVTHWKVITKLPGIPDACADVRSWVRKSVEDSLQRLNVSRLHGLLLHRPGQLLDFRDKELFRTLQNLKANGLVEKIGVSIYAPEELDELAGRFELDMVQAPLNVLDRRMIDSGWLDRLDASGVEIHVRSIFLQGLLLINSGKMPSKFDRWNVLWKEWDVWLESACLSPLKACLNFVLCQRQVDRVIVGVDGLEQLAEILKNLEGECPVPPITMACHDLELIDPTKW